MDDASNAVPTVSAPAGVDLDLIALSANADLMTSASTQSAPESFASPEVELAWKTYRAHPAVQAAQSWFTAREHQLQPMREAVMQLGAVFEHLRVQYNDVMTAERIKFQAAAHEPLLELTTTLQRLATENPPAAEGG